MTRKEIVLLMAVIRTAYPEYYRDQDYLEEAARLWYEMLKEEDAETIGKAVKEFIKSDRKGYPPKIGQIVSIARDVRLLEWKDKQHEELPEPYIAAPMPEELRQKMERLFTGI